MAAPMNSTQFRAIVEPVLNEVFDGVYDQRKDEWKKLFKSSTGMARAYHEEPFMFGFGMAPEVPDGAPIGYQSGGILYTARYVYKQYGMGYAMTKIMQEDSEHIRLGSIFARHLAQSMIETEETVMANIINRAHNSSYIGGDGKTLIATDHPTAIGTYSNQLTTTAALSQTSLEQLLIQVRNATDSTGKKIQLTGKRLVIPTSLIFIAEVILNSVQKSGTANNDLNAVKSLGLLPEGAHVLSRMTSTTAWYIQTDVPEGLKRLNRRPLTKGMEGDFDTDSVKYKATMRFGAGWSDPRDLWGTAGA